MNAFLPGSVLRLNAQPAGMVTIRERMTVSAV